MRKMIKVVMVFTFVAIGMTSVFIANGSEASANSTNDPRRYKELDEAADQAGRRAGCKTIPFSDLKRECERASSDRDRYCKGSNQPEKCDPLRNQVRQAARDEDEAELERLVELCTERKSHGKRCSQIRTRVQLAYKRANGKLVREKREHERKERAAKTALDKAHYKDMAGFIAKILAYYQGEIDGHAQQISQLERLSRKCEDIIRESR